MWRSLILLSATLACVSCHGRVLQPPGRGSAWRFGFPTRFNYDDDGLNCGGFSHQWSENGGRCGICGDSYDSPTPRAHELGGTYGEGIIVAQYLSGATFTATVEITASHQGFWEFKLCPDPEDNEQACFDQLPLELEGGGTKYYPRSGSAKYDVNYVLPPGLSCDHCVLQWRYTAGNNWGVCSNGTQGLGCGNQEQFGACSDISIGSSSDYEENEVSDSSDEAQYQLLNLLRHGYFNAQQGILQLLRAGYPPPERQKAPAKPSRHKSKGKRTKKSKSKSKYKWNKVNIFN